MPIPASLGGGITVPCCISCHDMKDRFNFENWPSTWLEPILGDLPKLSRETKIAIMKMFKITCEAKAYMDEQKSLHNKDISTER